ncbi:unnamed protein product [Dibothriocephalus latus]|uniref:Endonuclease/exonuclease/phosphatase domain-containing protein n=1 Tax=Dibothriocephalus latus TaxID=60516 RepID=A0A3P7NS09_DIBLA|nr:unnamed protein product [Dibothriocephalus latus]
MDETCHDEAWASPMKRSLKILSANVKRLFNKLDELKNLVDEEKPDMAAFNQTWFSTDIADSEVLLRGYQLFRRDRPTREGGVIVYVTGKLTAMAEEPIPARESQILNITISAKYARPLRISVVYRSPNQTSNQETILIAEQYKTSENKEILVVGDFNSPGADW